MTIKSGFLLRISTKGSNIYGSTRPSFQISLLNPSTNMSCKHNIVSILNLADFQHTIFEWIDSG